MSAWIMVHYDASVRVDYPDQGQKVAEAIIAGEVRERCPDLWNWNQYFSGSEQSTG